MEFLHAAIALLASMVLVLAGMVGWLYWQQQRMFQGQNNITMVLGEMARAIAGPPQVVQEEEEEAEEEPEVSEVEIPTIKTEPVEIDDRVSVDEGPEIVEGTSTVFDTDGLESKTKKDLQDILNKRGIPFGKGDSKGVLLSLLKATS